MTIEDIYNCGLYQKTTRYFFNLHRIWGTRKRNRIGYWIYSCTRLLGGWDGHMTTTTICKQCNSEFRTFPQQIENSVLGSVTMQVIMQIIEKKNVLEKAEQFKKFKENGYSDKRRASQRKDKKNRHLVITSSNNPLTKEEWLFMLKENDYKCIRCKTSKDLTQDHIIPISQGGTHTKSNIQVLCRVCNAIKGSKIEKYECFDSM